MFILAAGCRTGRERSHAIAVALTESVSPGTRCGDRDGKKVKGRGEGEGKQRRREVAFVF